MCMKKYTCMYVARGLMRGNDRATTGQGEDVGCGLGLKYTLIVAAVISKVEIIQQKSKN